MNKFFKIDKKEQLQYCARKIYAERLRQAGFVSYNEEDLSWYKVVNGQVLHTVYLFSMHTSVPLLLTVGYGYHPLFVPAPIPQKIAFGDIPDDEGMRWVRKPSAKYATYDGTLVFCHSSAKCGEEILDENVFPELDIAATEEGAYELHRDRCIKKVSEYKKRGELASLQIVGSEWLADEAIYFGDREIQQLMISQLIRQRDSAENSKVASKRKKLEWRKAQVEAIQSGDCETFLTMLEARKRRFIKDLDRKLGIQV